MKRAIAFSLVIGAAGGLGAGLFVSQSAPFVAVPSRHEAVPDSARDEASMRRETSTSRPPAEAPEPPRPHDEPFVTEALRAYARAKFVEGWLAARSTPPTDEDVARGVAEFERQVLDLPAALGRQAAERRDREEARDRASKDGDGIALVRSAENGSFRATRDTFETDLLDRCVARRSSERVIDGDDFAANRDAAPSEGLTLTFGPGLHKLDARRFRTTREPFPADVAIRGAGANATLLQVGDLFMDGEVRRLSIRDISIDCANNYLFDLRVAPMTLDLDHVRVVRFDMGAGSSLVFGLRGAVIRAQDCEFLGGYGRNPGSGNLMRGGPVIARFSRCRFELLDLHLNEVGENGFALFEECSFVYVQSRNPSANAALENCRFDEPAEPPPTKPKELTDLFPFLSR